MTQESHLTHAMRIWQRHGFKRALTYWKAALAEPEAMQQWRAFVEAEVEAEAQGGMLLRPYRPYMRQHFTPEERRDMLRVHRRVMAEHFTPDHRLTHDEPGLVVATLTGKSGDAYTVHIGGNTSKEGELSFTLNDPSGHYMAKMAASVGRDEKGERVLWIGGLQGAKPPLGRDEVVKATRDLYGLRPKGAVMLAAQAFAQMLGLVALRAPGNEGHISQRGFRKLREKRKIYADYGQFWEEIGGTRHATLHDEYVLPVVPQVRDLAEVKPNKRSEWKKRQAISEELAAQLRSTLEGLAKR